MTETMLVPLESLECFLFLKKIPYFRLWNLCFWMSLGGSSSQFRRISNPFRRKSSYMRRIPMAELCFYHSFWSSVFLQVSPLCPYLTRVCIQKYVNFVPCSSSINNYTWDMSTLINRAIVSLTRFRLKQHLIIPRHSVSSRVPRSGREFSDK